MLGQNRRLNSNTVSLVIATTLVVITFALIGFVALSVITGNDFGLGSQASSTGPEPRVALTPAQVVIGTPDPATMTNFTHKGLGFGLQYPKGWRRSQQGLEVILSPSAAGLDSDNIEAAALWIGIPPDNSTDTATLLTRLQSSLSAESQVVDSGSRIIGGQPWQSITIRFEHEPFAGEALATIAATNRLDVGYYLVTLTPTTQQPTLQPQFQAILDSLQFTAEAVLRPTDATPPPTPTPTPTPVIYIVQSGDTLLKISLQYGVDVEALARRNRIDDPRALRTGTLLIIPIPRRSQ